MLSAIWDYAPHNVIASLILYSLPPVSLSPPLTATQLILSPLTLDNKPRPFPKII